MHREIILLISGMALVTFFTRFTSFALFKTTGIPLWLNRWLKHIPTAILTALIIPSLLLPAGKLDISLQNPYLIAGVISAFVSFRFKNIIITLSLGLGTMIVLHLFSGILG